MLDRLAVTTHCRSDHHLHHAQAPEAIFAPKLISRQDLSRCEELGAAFAAGLTLGIF